MDPSRSIRLVRPAIAGLASVLLTFSCGPSYHTPPLTPQLVKSSPAPQSILERGYSLHQAKCAKCHAFENPADYPIAELTNEIMPEMARKAKLDAVDAQAVLAYLLAARKLSPQAQ